MNPQRRIPLMLSLMAAMLASGACRQILDIEERDATKAPLVAGVCGDFLYERASCAACMDDTCCESMERCSESQGCSDFSRCHLACSKTDSECLSRCAWAVLRNRPVVADARECRSACAEACGEPCGGWALRGHPSCIRCAQETCCSPMRACMADARCLAFDRCTDDCSLVQGCHDRCGELHPDGAAAYAQATSCIRSNCGNHCDQNDWRCLDDAKTANLGGGGRSITVDLRLYNFTSGTPWQDVTVQACSSTDLRCATPVATVSTDSQGGALLVLPQSDRGFDGYFQVEGNGIATGTLRFEPPLFEDSGPEGTAWPSASDFNGLALISGITPMPERGHAIVQVHHCTNLFGGGVTMTFDKADGQSQAYYFNDLLPDVSATTTDLESGIGGIMNLPPGLTNVTLTVAETQQEILSVPLLIRAGMISYLSARAQ